MSIRTPWETPFDRSSRPDNQGPGLTGLTSVLPDPRSTGLTYEPFYGLKEKPFSLTSDSKFFYHSRSHAPAFDDLLAGIRRRESLNVLSGDIGTGKTTLCRAVLENLDRKTFSAFVSDPFASREDLLKVLLMDFGVASVDDVTSGRLQDASRTELSYLLYEFLGTLAPLQAFAVVIIDEAQSLSLPLLEELRILSDADGQLQIVLVGQLELRDKLKLPEMRQLDQRVSVHCTLQPLTCEGVGGYVAHRLQTAGGSPDRIRFSQEAIESLYLVSNGVPRVINRLCDRALHHGYLRRAATIDLEIFEAALPETAQAPSLAPRPAVSRPAPSVAKPEQAPAVAAAAARSAAASPAPAPAPSSEAPAAAAPALDLSDPINAWLNSVDDVATPARPGQTVKDLAPVMPDLNRPMRLVAPGTDLSEGSAAGRPGFVLRAGVHRTATERFVSRWLRRVGMALVALIVFAFLVVGGPTLLDVSADLWVAASDSVSPPRVPALPPALAPAAAPALKMPATPAIDEPVAFSDPQSGR